MIRDSAEAGATTVKFQLFTADTLWRYGSPQYFVASRFEVGVEWLPDLAQKAEEHKVEFLCTPFSPEAVGELEKVGVKRYKVSSGDITYTALLQAVADARKPVLLSVGYSTWDEIDTALGILRGKDSNLPITLMHSTGAFPTEPADSRIKRILALVQRYGMSTYG
jgi:sialic acid synthase SpsE